MGYFLKVVIFVAGFLILFTYIAFQIPQQASLPPGEEKFDAAQIQSKNDLVQIGSKLFYGKGQCALCHSIGHSATARCPNLQGIGGKLTREFIYESLTEPQAYTFMDYTYSPPKFFPATMPVITKPPIDLNDNELLSMIAFIESQGGEVTVDPSEIITAGDDGGLGGGDAENGKSVFAKKGCTDCHAPDALGTAVSEKDNSVVRMAILDPNAGVRGDPKPVHKGLDEKLTVKQFSDLVAYIGSISKAATSE